MKSRPPVRVVKLRTLTPATGPDLTAPLRQGAALGTLVEMEVGRALRVRLADGREWRTSPIRSITPGVKFTEVTTTNSVYWVHRLTR